MQRAFTVLLFLAAIALVLLCVGTAAEDATPSPSEVSDQTTNQQAEASRKDNGKRIFRRGGAAANGSVALNQTCASKALSKLRCFSSRIRQRFSDIRASVKTYTLNKINGIKNFVNSKVQGVKDRIKRRKELREAKKRKVQEDKDKKKASTTK